MAEKRSSGKSRRKKTDEKVENLFPDWQTTFDSIRDLVMLFDKDFKITRVNLATKKFLGLPASKIIGKKCYTLFHGTSRPPEVCPLKKAKQTKKHEELEIYLSEKDVWILASVDLILDGKGRICKAVHIIKNITEKKKAEEALKECEEKFRTIFEGATDGILAADVKTKKFVFANPEICKVTGYSVKELLKLSVDKIHPKKDLPYVMDQFTKQLQGKITIATNIPVLRKDKRIVYCDVSSKPVKFGEEEALLGFFRDITERKKAHEELLKSYRTQSDLLENAPFGIMTINTNGIVDYVNPAMLMISGSDEKKFIGLNIFKLPTYVKIGLSQKIRMCFKGKPFFVEALEYTSFYGKKKSIRNFTGIPMKDKTGKINRVTLFVEDITSIKEAEEAFQKRTEELEKFNRLAVGRELQMVELKKRIKELEGKLRSG